MPYPVIPGAPTGNVQVLPPVSPITASNTAVAAASCSASLPAVANQTNYVTGFVVSSHAPLAVQSGLVTVTGVNGGTLNYYFVENVTYGGELIVTFPSPMPASAANVAIAVNLPAIASGAATSVTVFGYVQ